MMDFEDNMTDQVTDELKRNHRSRQAPPQHILKVKFKFNPSNNPPIPRTGDQRTIHTYFSTIPKDPNSGHPPPRAESLESVEKIQITPNSSTVPAPRDDLKDLRLPPTGLGRTIPGKAEFITENQDVIKDNPSKISINGFPMF